MNIKVKSYSNLARTLFAQVLMLTFLLFAACNKCRKIDCQNGTCVSGECECEEGYFGDRCETAWRDRVTGLFDVFQICNSGVFTDFQGNILERGDDPRKFNIRNLSQSGEDVKAKFVDSLNFVIPEQDFMGGKIFGEGERNMTAEMVYIRFGTTINSTNDSCAAEYSRIP